MKWKKALSPAAHVQCGSNIKVQVLVIMLGLAGCSGGELDNTTASVSEVIPTVLTVTWSSPSDGDSYLRYGQGEALDQEVPAVATDTGYTATVLGLKAGGQYSFQAVTVTDSGRELSSEVGSVQLAGLPPEFPDLTFSEYDEDRVQEGGYIITSLIAASDTSWLAIFDRDGDVVWYLETEPGHAVGTVIPSLDGKSLISVYNDLYQVTDISGTLRVSMDGSEQIVTRNVLGHHDFAELPDGNIAWLSMEVREVEVEGEVMSVLADTIEEAPEGFDQEVGFTHIFSYFDDYYPVYVPCEHFYAQLYGLEANDWSHANSLMYNEEDDAFYVLTKNLDALTKVDRQTGEIIWELGGKHNQFTVIGGEEELWSHGHMSQIWDGGFVIFDNGYHHYEEDNYSRVVEYALDEENMTIEKVWEFNDPSSPLILRLGDGMRLRDGNYLTSWTTSGVLQEFTPEGDVVWKAETSLGFQIGRVTWVENLYKLQ